MGVSPAAAAPGADSSGGYPATSQRDTPEAAWLDKIGRGNEQTAAVCGRGASDPIATALCALPSLAIGSLVELHQVLGVPNNGDTDRTGPVRLLGMTANSGSLVSRFVSALNPRVIVGVLPNDDDATPLRVFALGFTRGEPFVEMLGYDASAGRLNFYLLAFEPACASERCTPAELLTEDFESGWRGVTLYQAEDLTNTPLDCLSCHQPDGPDGARRVLMRQLRNPWMHWMPLEPRGVNCDDGNDNESANAEDGGTPAEEPSRQARYVSPTLFQTFRRAHGGEVRYAGIELGAFTTVLAGRQIETFVRTAQALVGARSGTRRGAGGRAGEPAEFPSRTILTETLCEDDHTAWQDYRARLRDAGLPTPYYLPDVLDPQQRDSIVRNFRAYLDSHAADDEFTLVSGWMSAPARAAIGFEPSPGASAEHILREMCVRCHNDRTDPALGRARFNAQSPERWTTEQARKALERIDLPSAAAERMPPRRFGELPGPALEAVKRYLRSRAEAAAP